jgi:prepilin-type N-terminal cleavage/methylation domain-containing protein
MNRKAFTLIELLVVVAIIGILAAVGVVAYGKYTTSAKIAASKEQHYSMKKFIEASYGQCALGDNYVLMNTCKLNNWSCNGLRVGNSDPGTVKRPCKSGAGSASNSAYHFVFHFNNSGFKNPYNLDGPTMLQMVVLIQNNVVWHKVLIQEYWAKLMFGDIIMTIELKLSQILETLVETMFI